MDPDRVVFMVNSYDPEGDVLEEGIFLSLENISIRLETIGDLEKLIERLEKIRKEIVQNYP